MARRQSRSSYEVWYSTVLTYEGPRYVYADSADEAKGLAFPELESLDNVHARPIVTDKITEKELDDELAKLGFA